jgi:hypothetical protein
VWGEGIESPSPATLPGSRSAQVTSQVPKRDVGRDGSQGGQIAVVAGIGHLGQTVGVGDTLAQRKPSRLAFLVPFGGPEHLEFASAILRGHGSASIRGA